MKVTKRYLAVLLLYVLFISTVAISTAISSGVDVDMQHGSGSWTGNTKSHLYQGLPEGYPRIPPHARYLGVLKGSWHDMGKQYGKKAGDLIRLHFDGCWPANLKKFGLAHALYDLHELEREAALFSPQVTDILKGMAEGAAEELDKSAFAREPTHYEKILYTFFKGEIMFRHPPYPHGPPMPISSSAIMQETQEQGCSAVVILGGQGGGTKDGKTIIGHNMGEGDFDPGMYKVVFIMDPDDPKANTFWSEAFPGQLGFSSVNNKGVSIGITAGSPVLSKVMPREKDFGVSWMVAEFMAVAYANSMKEVVSIITLGIEDYRAKTGRATLQRTGGTNYVIADRNNAAVLETTAHLYGIRYPGDTGETGKWIVVTNHQLANHSYNENNVRQDDPKFTLFGDENVSFFGTKMRYYTHWWNIKYNYGKIDENMVRNFMSAHYNIDKEGNRHDYYWDEKYGWVPAHLASGGSQTPCNHLGGYPEKYTGWTTASKVIVIDDDKVTAYWTIGRPCEWQGDWDSVTLPLAK